MNGIPSRYIGVPIIAIETASGVGARNAAATKIRRNAYARVRRRSATDNTPSLTRTRTTTGNSNATPKPTQSWVTNEKYSRTVQVGVQSSDFASRKKNRSVAGKTA